MGSTCGFRAEGPCSWAIDTSDKGWLAAPGSIGGMGALVLTSLSQNSSSRPFHSTGSTGLSSMSRPMCSHAVQVADSRLR